jgi:ABC-2 type transport system permease protein
MMSYEFRRTRVCLPLALAVQVLIGSGLVIGFGLLLGEIPPTAALYLSTGVTVISMITIGFVLAPQLIAQQKIAGTYEYLWSLPVPRTTWVAASLTVNTLIAVPGMVVALLVGVWRYDIDLDVSVLVLPAVFLTLGTAATIGMAMAHAIPNPMITMLATQILVFVIMLYSPINFPPDRLPDWLAAIHRFLPFEHMANVVRAGLTRGLATEVEFSFLVLGIWATASWSLTAWVVGRRS